MNPNCAALWKNKAGFEAQYGYSNPEQRAKGDAFRARIFGSQMEDAAWAAFRLAGRGQTGPRADCRGAWMFCCLTNRPIIWMWKLLNGWKTSCSDSQGRAGFAAHDRVFCGSCRQSCSLSWAFKAGCPQGQYSQFLSLQEEYEAQRQLKARALQDELGAQDGFVERFRAKATKARQAGSRQKTAKKLEKRT